MPASMIACVVLTSRCESPSSWTNSIEAPSSRAARSASATRCSGWPCVAASPREHTTRCATRPRRVSCAITPPHPNSMSSGCAPNASTGSRSGELDMGLVRSIDRVPPNERDLGRVAEVQVVLLAGAGDIVSAPQHGLHPSESRVARWADLLLAEVGRRDRDEGLAALVEQQRSILGARADDLALVRDVHEEVAHLARAPSHRGVARPDDFDAVEPPHPAIHLETEVRHRLHRRLPEQVDQLAVHVVGQLQKGARMPVRGNSLGVERRELPLNLAADREVERRRPTASAEPEDRARLARVMVAVVAEEHDAPAQFRLEAPRRLDLRDQEAPREEATGLLAERDDRPRAHALPATSATARGPRAAWSSTLNAMHAAHPMRLYQRYPMLRERNITMTRVCAATAAKNTAWPPTCRRKNATRKMPSTTP